MICSLESSESLLFSRDWNPTALSVETVIGPGCLTGVVRAMRLFLRSIAFSEFVRMACARFEKWSTKSMINWLFLFIMSA